MKKVLVCGLALAALVAMTATQRVAAQNLLQDGLLDTSVAGGGGAPGSNAFWTLTNTGNATAAQFQGGFANSANPQGFGVWYRAFLGNAQAPVSSTLSQSVPNAAGGKYLLQFDAVIEQNFTATSMVATLSSSGGPVATLDLLADKIPAGSSYTGGGFANIGAATPPYNIVKSLMLSGVNAGDTLTVSVAMTDGISGPTNPQSVVVDNFRLTRVPEPSSLALAGLGVLALRTVRRRRA